MWNVTGDLSEVLHSSSLVLQSVISPADSFLRITSALPQTASSRK